MYRDIFNMEGHFTPVFEQNGSGGEATYPIFIFSLLCS